MTTLLEIVFITLMLFNFVYCNKLFDAYLIIIAPFNVFLTVCFRFLDRLLYGHSQTFYHIILKRKLQLLLCKVLKNKIYLEELFCIE